MNRLYYGDCLTVMQKEMRSNSVDLIYLDPPFNSNRSYNAIYKDETGRPLPEQIDAFCDLWTLDAERERAIRDMPKFLIKNEIDPDIVQFWKVWMNALRQTNPKLLAYLSYMVERLVQMKILLKPTGSIYLHCDPTFSHYIKVIMDGVFGQKNFRNEIVWHYNKWTNTARFFQRDHDIILVYAKSASQCKFNKLFGKLSPDMKADRQRGYHIKSSGGTRLLTVYDRNNPKAKNKIAAGDYEKVYYIDNPHQGKPIADVWNDVKILGSAAKERLGYPTQKPLALLRRIIRAASDEGDIVLDPFCGCATTLEAAQELNRQWIGIDIAIHAVKRVSAIRLQEKCYIKEGVDYEISGIPSTIEGATDLHKRDPYHFQKWAVEMVDGFVTAQKSNDGGVDGRIYYHDNDELKAMKVSVKGGQRVNPDDLRSLAGIIDEQDFPMGGLITLKTLGRLQRQNFEDFCRTKGTISVGGTEYPRLQVLCVEEILDGKPFNTPLVRGRSTTDQLEIFNKAVEEKIAG